MLSTVLSDNIIVEELKTSGKDNAIKLLNYAIISCKQIVESNLSFPKYKILRLIIIFFCVPLVYIGFFNSNQKLFIFYSRDNLEPIAFFTCSVKGLISNLAIYKKTPFFRLILSKEDIIIDFLSLTINKKDSGFRLIAIVEHMGIFNKFLCKKKFEKIANNEGRRFLYDNEEKIMCFVWKFIKSWACIYTKHFS